MKTCFSSKKCGRQVCYPTSLVLLVNTELSLGRGPFGNVGPTPDLTQILLSKMSYRESDAHRQPKHGENTEDPENAGAKAFDAALQTSRQGLRASAGSQKLENGAEN